MSKSKDAGAVPAILDYLRKQNRPYSAVDILNNLHKEYGKTAVVKALDTLVAEGKIKSKTYNKQVVYVTDQTQFPDVNDSELKSMESKVVAMAQKLKESSDVVRQLDSELQALCSSLTTDEAKSQVIQLTKECDQLEEKLKSLKSSVNTVSPKEREQILKSRSTNVKEWRKRKRICTDMMSAILEGYPKSKKEFLEEVGVETDESLSLKPPDL